MKKIIALMLGLVATTASFAHTTEVSPVETPQTKLVVKSDQKVRLLVTAQPIEARIVLSDAAGHVLYSENQILDKGLNQQFDISNLANGTYQFTIDMKGQTQTKAFVVQEQTTQRVVITQN